MLTVMTRRSDFLAASKSGIKFVRPTVIVQLRKRHPDELSDASVRVGFTATKTLGNAVIRNRVKRRLRAAARQLLPTMGIAGTDYVFIGREQSYKGSFDSLIHDVKHALKRLPDILYKQQTS